ncbi:rod-binding protein [Hoeflea alexandrii]|uniref:rod-binding protein n=1 Tax=Hoeflea alexandrii TaxID=288436 RepID=UPI0022B07D6C|nr:rod-binding protein [Hoeflea alexandrii]MCZ4290537.1 rod-binding protein [Hoeflea alexandrii]
MSIQTATDIILDVVRAADPAVAQRAEAMLEAASIRKSEQAAATPAFQHQLLASADQSSVSVASAQDAAPDKSLEVYQRFEAMILQNFVGSMLPTDSEQLYGEGTAGEIWKGMMAEQLGAVLAKGGGIGIAARMMGDRLNAPVAPESADAIGSNVSNRAAGLINEIQKQILADVAGSVETTDQTEKSSQGQQAA